ncbi:Uncharacterized protein TCM_043802 [Theobroma cacao]|uniref:Uncharacterized protein n=1 Tax=Theobroma cacao TaxID=3641 RepID=A0A061FWA5_THECC|nr:Uncharacterized protein TCM_043802 [Theobroma cacao]
MPTGQGNGQRRSESGAWVTNESVDFLIGSGEHSPMGEQNANLTNSLVGNNQSSPTIAWPRERMEDHVDNPPTQESVSGKCMHNKKLSDVPSDPSFFETKFTKIEVHLRIRHRKHSDAEILIDKILSLVSDNRGYVGK